jgi:pantothenate kinase
LEEEKNFDMNEKIDGIISKFVSYRITIDELRELAPLLSTEEFEYQYAFLEDLQSVFQDEGKVELMAELKQIIIEEKQKEAKSKLGRLKDYTIYAIAACVLIACTVGVIKSTTGYNDVKNFRKTYIEKSS